MKKLFDTNNSGLLVEVLLKRFQSRYLPPAWRLENSESSRLTLAAIATICTLVIGFILWMSFTPIEEIAVAPGEIVPAGNVEAVQHLEGGIVKDIYVKDGQKVKPGQLLVKLDTTAAISELNQMQIHAAGLAGGETQMEDTAQKIDTLRTKTTRLSSQLEILNKQLSLQKQELNMFKELSSTGAASKREYLIAQQRVMQIQGDITKIKHEFAQTNSMIKNLEDKVKRSEIRASTYGVVQGLKLHVGNVIKPGETFMSIVPLNQNLIAEARISTTDIGHIQINAPVNVKVQTYNYTQYGVIKGKLIEVSATTFVDEKNIPYYQAKIALDHDYVNNDPVKKVKPGMTIEANINTGSKTLLKYLLQPMKTTVSSSFHER